MTSTNDAPAATVDSARDGYRATPSFDAAPETVFDALTTTDAISRWGAPCTGSGRAGGRLQFLFGDAALVVNVVAAERSRHLRWEVTVSEPLPEWVGTHIDFALRPGDGGGTVLDFCHEGLTDAFECFDMCIAGMAAVPAEPGRLRRPRRRDRLRLQERRAGSALGPDSLPQLSGVESDPARAHEEEQRRAPRHRRPVVPTWRSRRLVDPHPLQSLGLSGTDESPPA